MDGTEQPRQVLVKCVLVGDNAVGKTRLICARARNTKVSLSQLLNTHVPTVWAIDQYRIYKEVLENSWETVDGVEVSLRLWDTFGDHHKDRRFAYGRSDVVLMCFDIGRLSSLEHCRSMWYNQIRRFCPQTPIILVGCKNDTRFIYKDDQYLRYCKERSPLVRQVWERDLVLPEQGRAAAREMGVPYFETSVLTFFGVNEVFENAIRAALCARRTQRFWMSGLKRVIRPKLQEPFCPPRPPLPRAATLPSSFPADLATLFHDSSLADCILSCGPVGFSAHGFLLAAVSPLFRRVLAPGPPALHRSSSESSLVSSPGSSPVPDRSMSSIEGRSSPLLRRNSFCGSSLDDCLSAAPAPLHPAFQSVERVQCSSLDGEGQTVTSLRTVITLRPTVAACAVGPVLQFLYTGCPGLPVRASPRVLACIAQAAEVLEIPLLRKHLANLRSKEHLRNTELAAQVVETMSSQLEEVLLGRGLGADISFALEDGQVAAHKPLLMARCDMMRAMFTDDFLESSARVVAFPGTSCAAFRALLHYLYTDSCPRTTPASAMPVIELANRLVLPRLVSLLEEATVRQLELELEQGGDCLAAALQLLQPAQVHRAPQLAAWTHAYLAQSYAALQARFPREVRSLAPDNQAALNIHRWPPPWYLRDLELYQRMEADVRRRERLKPLKRSREAAGCLCFASKASKGSG